LNPEDIENLNKSIANNEIRAVVKKFPKRKAHVLIDSLLIFYQNFKEKLTPMLQIIP
jgi:hypothetical protein